MTREEAKGNLIHAIRWNDIPKKEALEMAIQALSQEPCEDAISREAARDLMYHKQEPLTEYDLDTLPSVIPKPKTGHWIYKQYDGYPECGDYHCSACDKIDNRTPTYCPNCGAKMTDKTLISED